MEVLGGNKDAHHCRLLITTWPDICTFQTIGIVWEVGGNGEAGVHSIAGVDGYNSIRCLSMHITAAAQHRFTSFSESLNQTTLKSPGFENGNLDRPKPWDADSKHVFVPLCRYLITTWLLFFLPHASSSSHQSLNFMVVRQVAHMRHQNAPKRLNHGRRSWKNHGVSRLGWTLVAKVWHHKKKWHKQRMKLVSVFSGFGYCSRGVGSSSVMYVRQAAHLRH